MNIWETIESIINLCEERQAIERDGENKLLYLLDSLTVQMHSIMPSGTFEGKIIPENDYNNIRTVIERRFPNWGYYNTVGDVTKKIMDTEILTGDVIDDITDTLNDLKMVMWSYTNENEQTAIWHLHDSYHHHWRSHLRNLQNYIHCLENEI